MSSLAVMRLPPSMLAAVWLAIWLTSTEPAIATPSLRVDAPPLAAAATIRDASAARTRTSCTPSMSAPLTDARVLSPTSAYVTAAPRPALPPAYSAPPPLAIFEAFTALTSTSAAAPLMPRMVPPTMLAAVSLWDIATVAEIAPAPAELWLEEAFTPTLSPTLTCSLSLRAVTVTVPASSTLLSRNCAVVVFWMSP